MLKDFNQFLSEGVHAEFRKLTNAKVVNAVDLTLKHLGIDLHYCKFSDNGKFPNVLQGLTTGCDISLIVTDNDGDGTTKANKTFEVYVVVDIGDRIYYHISQDGFVKNLDEFPEGLKGHLFTIESYGYDSRDSAIVRDKKNLDKGTDDKIAYKYNVFVKDKTVDLSDTDKNIKASINGLTKIVDSSKDLINKFNDIVNGESIKAGMVKSLENYQKKLLKLSSTIEDCKQSFITSRNGL